MGVDLGERRVGVALSDPGRTLATPFTCLEGRDRDRMLAQLARLAREHQVAAIVVGLPYNMDGSLGRQGQLCQEIAAILSRKTGLPVHLEDERLSSQEAAERLRSRGRRREQTLDPLAAALILQGYLDRLVNSG